MRVAGRSPLQHNQSHNAEFIFFMLSRGYIFAQNRIIFFVPPPLLQKYYFPQVQVKISYFIFSPVNQYFIFFFWGAGGGAKWNIYTTVVVAWWIVRAKEYGNSRSTLHHGQNCPYFKSGFTIFLRRTFLTRPNEENRFCIKSVMPGRWPRRTSPSSGRHTEVLNK